jgi:hypothetical protein
MIRPLCYQLQYGSGGWSPKECVVLAPGQCPDELMRKWQVDFGADRLRFWRGTKLVSPGRCSCSACKGRGRQPGHAGALTEALLDFLETTRDEPQAGASRRPGRKPPPPGTRVIAESLDEDMGDDDSDPEAPDDYGPPDEDIGRRRKRRKRGGDDMAQGPNDEPLNDRDDDEDEEFLEERYHSRGYLNAVNRDLGAILARMDEAGWRSYRPAPPVVVVRNTTAAELARRRARAKWFKTFGIP